MGFEFEPRKQSFSFFHMILSIGINEEMNVDETRDRTGGQAELYVWKDCRDLCQPAVGFALQHLSIRVEKIIVGDTKPLNNGVAGFYG